MISVEPAPCRRSRGVGVMEYRGDAWPAKGKRALPAPGRRKRSRFRLARADWMPAPAILLGDLQRFCEPFLQRIEIYEDFPRLRPVSRPHIPAHFQNIENPRGARVSQPQPPLKERSGRLPLL